MTIINFLSPLLSTGAVWWVELFGGLFLFLEGIIYEIVTYSYKLFTLITQLNFNSVAALMGPLIDRLKAVIMVLIVYKLGVALVGMLLNPDGAPKEGKKLLLNIFVTIALLVSYNFIFSVVNEVGMLFVGAPAGYTFPTLSNLTGTTITEEEGIINRFVFGKGNSSTEKMSEMGDYMAYQVASIFVVNLTDEDTLGNTIKGDNGKYNFLKLPNLHSQIDKKVSYTPLAGILIGGYLIYVFFVISAEVGIRMFKLLILQMLAPLAIITMITEGDGGKFGKTMKSYVKTYSSIFTQVFIRLITTLVITVFIAKFTTNLGEYFGSITDLSDGLLTQGLLIVLVIYAGYKFVLQAPKLIDQVFGTHVADGNGDSGFAGLMLGGAAGLATGLVSGYRSGAGEGGWNKATGALAGGLAGMTTGAWTGATKGNGIADKFKNMQTINDASKKRGENWAAKGGFNNVFMGGLNDISGRTKRQDAQMAAYQREEERIKAYEAAQAEAIKDEKVSQDDIDSVFGAGNNPYHAASSNVKYSSDRDSFVQQIVQYDKGAEAAQQTYDAALKSGDTDAIMTARSDLAKAKKQAEENAKQLYDHKRQNASGDAVQAAELAVKRAQRETVTATNNVREVVIEGGEPEKKLGKNDRVDIDAEKARLKAKQSAIQSDYGYKMTHDGMLRFMGSQRVGHD